MSGRSTKLKKKRRPRAQTGQSDSGATSVSRTGARAAGGPSGLSDDDDDELERSTDRELMRAAQQGRMRDPRSLGPLERELMSMNKARLVGIIMKFEKKYGREKLALAMMAGDEDDDWMLDDSSDSSDSSDTKFAQVKVKNLDTGEEHGEDSIDEFMADPRVITAARTITNLDTGRRRRIRTHGVGVSSEPPRTPTPTQHRRVVQQPKSPMQKLSGWFKKRIAPSGGRVIPKDPRRV